MQKVEFHILKKKKTCLQNLAEGKIKIKDLPRYCTTVCNIVKLGLQQYEKHSKISSGTHRKMGKNRRQNSCERSSKIKTMDPSVPLLVFSPDAGYKEHLSTQMNFDIRSLQLCLVNAPEVFLCLTPNIESIGNTFPPVEELFFYCQNLLSEKTIVNRYIFVLFMKMNNIYLLVNSTQIILLKFLLTLSSQSILPLVTESWSVSSLHLPCPIV